MCYACNPQCGNCKPKKIVATICPSCGASVSMTREEYLVLFDLPHKQTILTRKLIENEGVDEPTCPSCATSVVDAFRQEVLAEWCEREQITCGFPCGRTSEPYEEGAPPCAFRVPIEAPAAPGAREADQAVPAGCAEPDNKR